MTNCTKFADSVRDSRRLLAFESCLDLSPLPEFNTGCAEAWQLGTRMPCCNVEVCMIISHLLITAKMRLSDTNVHLMNVMLLCTCNWMYDYGYTCARNIMHRTYATSGSPFCACLRTVSECQCKRCKCHFCAHPDGLLASTCRANTPFLRGINFLIMIMGFPCDLFEHHCY